MKYSVFHSILKSKFTLQAQLLAGQRDRAMINEAMAEYRKLTCIKWVPRTGSERDYVYITNGNTGCWSSVGKIGGRSLPVLLVVAYANCRR